jgi:acyl-coenzyme A thioesterase PaaI-like protein
VRKIVKAQNVSKMCFVCGRQNPAGLAGSFYELEGGELLGVFDTSDIHQGYPQRLHGGLATTILDETIGRAVNISDPNAWGVTVELTSVRFRKPVPVGGTVRVLARITSDSSRLFEGSGELLLDDGTVAVEATGKYLKMPIDRIVDEDFASQWFADPRRAPAEADV